RRRRCCLCRSRSSPGLDSRAESEHQQPRTPHSPSAPRRGRPAFRSRAGRTHELARGLDTWSSANAQSTALEKRFHFIASHPGEIAGDGMLDSTDGYAIIEASLQIAIQQSVNQAGREGIAGAQTIDDLDFISSRSENLISPACDGRPAILP